MIQTSSAFAAANAALAKIPIYVIEVAGYSRAFTNAPNPALAFGASFAGLSPDIVLEAEGFSTDGGFTSHPGTVTLNEASAAGELLIAIMLHADGGGSPAVSDTAGNTWTHRITNFGAPNATVNVWTAISPGIAAGDQITFTTGGNRGNCFFAVLRLPATYATFVTGTNSGSGILVTVSTSDGDVMNIPNGPNVSTGWGAVSISFSGPSGANAGLAIGIVNFGVAGQAPDDASSIIIDGSAGGSGAYVVMSTLVSGYDWLVSIEDMKITVSDLAGSADLGDLIFNVQDRGQQLTADLASFVFEGKAARLLVGSQGMALSDFATFFIGAIDTVDSDNSNLEYTFTASDINLKKLSQKIYTQSDPDTNGNTVAVSSKRTRSLQGHPLDILVSALEQAGVPSSLIDTAKIQFYRDTIFNGLEYVFTLTAAPTAKDFIEKELMQPLGMYLWENNLGVISVNSFYPAISGNGTYTPPTPPVMTLTVDNTITVPLASEADLMNQIVFDFDDDGTGSNKFLSEEIVDTDESISKYNLVNGETIQSQGLRSDFQGFFMATLVGRLIGLRYGFKALMLDPLTLFWSCATLEPGDIVAVTNAFVPDRVAGVLGVTGKTFEVLDRNWKFKTGQVEVKLLAINLAAFKQFLIAPNAEADYASASPTDQGKYMFLCGTNDKYSTGAAANTLG